MKHSIAALAGAASAAIVSVVFAAPATPTFRAEVENGNTLVIYSASDKDVACYTFVTFSYQKDDKREVSRYVCNGFARTGKDFRFCARTNEKYIDLKIESPVTASCG